MLLYCGLLNTIQQNPFLRWTASAIVAGLFILLGVIALHSVTASAAELTPRQAFKLMEQSVFPVSPGGEAVCTAFMIGPDAAATAGHCTKKSKYWSHYFIRDRKLVTMYHRDDAWEDFGLLAFYVNHKFSKALDYDCEWQPRVGEPIATYGYPVVAGAVPQAVLKVGIVSSRLVHDKNKTAFARAADFTIAAGFSGAPVISMNSGKVVGIAAVDVSMSNNRGLGGFILIKDTALCRADG